MSCFLVNLLRIFVKFFTIQNITLPIVKTIFIVVQLFEIMSNINTDNKNIKRQIDKFQKSGNIQKAIEACQSAILENENDAELHIKLGDLYMEWHLDIHQIRQYTDEAITEYQRALESCMNSSSVYYKLGMAFYYKRELDKAINYFKLALEFDTKLSEAHFMIAEVFMKKGDFLEAIESAQRAIDIAPFSSSRAYFLIYNVMLHSAKSKWYQKYPKLLMSFITLPFDKYARVEFLKRLSYLKFLPILLKTSLLKMTTPHRLNLTDIRLFLPVETF